MTRIRKWNLTYWGYKGEYLSDYLDCSRLDQEREWIEIANDSLHSRSGKARAIWILCIEHGTEHSIIPISNPVYIASVVDIVNCTKNPSLSEQTLPMKQKPRQMTELTRAHPITF